MTAHALAPKAPNTARGWKPAIRYLAVGVGSLFAALVSVAGLTAAEGFLVRERLMPTRIATSSGARGLFGGNHDGAPIHLVLMGDSLAVGYGAEAESETVGVRLAGLLSDATERPVQLDNVAEVGAESIGLIAQLIAVRRFATPPDVVVIIVGANDVMHLRPLVAALRPLRETITEVRRLGARVVVASCPDLGTVRSFFEPLRFFAHWLSRLLATSQTIVALRAGARTLSLADSMGPLFRKDPGTMFSQLDRLHPSGTGYSRTAEVLLPSVRAAAGYPDASERTPHRVYDKSTRHPLAWLAFRASRRAGARLRHVNDVPSVA
ncbi:SGNH/GDSL hydrolase family protein [Humibacter antri]